jgi:hypothetical protein
MRSYQEFREPVKVQPLYDQQVVTAYPYFKDSGYGREY